MSSIPLDQIKLTTRHRKELGDITGLAESISTIGLLHPIVLNPDHQVIAGERRLAAVRNLGWSEVSATVIHSLEDAGLALQAERDENTCRKDFTTLEAVALGRDLEKLERPEAKERQKKHGGTAPGRKNTSGKFPEVSGQTRDKVGAAVGINGKTYSKAKFVATKAEQDPVLYGPIAEEMEKTGKVDPAYKKAKRQENLGQVPLADAKIERTVANELEECLAAFRSRLLGIRKQHGKWIEIAGKLDEQTRQHLIDFSVRSLSKTLNEIVEAFSNG